jgi:hypothetical protein
MATAERRIPSPNAQPPGVEGEGLDPYPTYRDGPTTQHRVTVTKPTDVGLPRSRRTYALPILIGLIAFALVIIVRIIWGSFNAVEATDEAMTPGDAAVPAASEPAADSAAEQSPPAETDQVGDEPGPVDVPGGETSDPPEPESQ